MVSNHVSYLDIIVNGYLCVPEKFHFIGQIDGFKGIIKLLICAFYYICGVIPLDRKNDQSREKVLKRAIKVLEKGNILILYPEGRRSDNGQVQQGKFGSAKILLKTGAPIVPAGIKGTFDLMPPKGKLKIKRVVEVNVGKPLYFKEEIKKAKSLECDSEDYKKLCQKITDATMKEINSLVTGS